MAVCIRREGIESARAASGIRASTLCNMNAVGCIPFEQTTESYRRCRNHADTFAVTFAICDMESVIAHTYACCMRDAAFYLLRNHALINREDKAVVEMFADLSNGGQRACDYVACPLERFEDSS